MKKITIIVGVVCMMSSCGIQFGNYERYKQLNRPSMCQEDQREYEFTSAHECENCDEIN
jgi:hypothetical protein